MEKLETLTSLNNTPRGSFKQPIISPGDTTRRDYDSNFVDALVLFRERQQMLQKDIKNIFNPTRMNDFQKIPMEYSEACHRNQARPEVQIGTSIHKLPDSIIIQNRALKDKQSLAIADGLN